MNQRANDESIRQPSNQPISQSILSSAKFHGPVAVCESANQWTKKPMMTQSSNLTSNQPPNQAISQSIPNSRVNQATYQATSQLINSKFYMFQEPVAVCESANQWTKNQWWLNQTSNLVTNHPTKQPVIQSNSKLLSQSGNLSSNQSVNQFLTLRVSGTCCCVWRRRWSLWRRQTTRSTWRDASRCFRTWASVSSRHGYSIPGTRLLLCPYVVVWSNSYVSTEAIMVFQLFVHYSSQRFLHIWTSLAHKLMNNWMNKYR